MYLLYHAYVYLEFLILACTIYILAPQQHSEAVWSERSECWIWGVVGAAMGAYDGYKYAKKKGYKG